MRQSENNSEGAERGPKVRTRRDNVLSFREGHVYMALKMLSPCDQNQDPGSAPFPRVVFLVDGKYVRMPADENLLRRLGTFMLRVSELLDGIEVPEKELDLEGARRKMRGYIEQSASIPSSIQEHTARGRELTNDIVFHHDPKVRRVRASRPPLSSILPDGPPSAKRPPGGVAIVARRALRDRVTKKQAVRPPQGRSPAGAGRFSNGA